MITTTSLRSLIDIGTDTHDTYDDDDDINCPEQCSAGLQLRLDTDEVIVNDIWRHEIWYDIVLSQHHTLAAAAAAADDDDDDEDDDGDQWRHFSQS